MTEGMDMEEMLESNECLRRNTCKCDVRFVDMTGRIAAVSAAARPGEQSADGGYAPLREVLDEAFAQAVSGKGAERHGSGEPFLEQPIMTIQRHLGNEGFALGQAAKKLFEAGRLPGEAGDREILGAIVYAAAAVLRRRAKRMEEGR